MSSPVRHADPWESLRRYTSARIALGRAGVSLPTGAHLEFQLAHALARDAVHASVDWQTIEQGIATLHLHTIRLHSQATDRNTYLQRPDLGRSLDQASTQKLAECIHAFDPRVLEITTDGSLIRYDVAFVLVDGLSACAIQRQALPLLSEISASLHHASWQIAPVACVDQGRVAIGDAIGAALGAAIVVVFVGERPGLSSPDSLGIYLTHAPRLGTPDSLRNCISNVRPEGLAPADAARKLHYLLTESRRRRISGVLLKDEQETDVRLGTTTGNFLTAGPSGKSSSELES